MEQPEFLRGDFGKAVFEEYQRIAKENYNDTSALKILKYEDGIVKGSNPFAVVLINQIIKQKGLRTATQADLERIIKTDTDFLKLRVYYEDSALVLRSTDESNKYLANNLAEQIKARQKSEIKYPIMIALSDLELVNDSKSNYGLSFKLGERAKTVYAPILNKGGKFTSKDIDRKTGLPRKLDANGNRYLFSKDSGLSRLVLDRHLYLYSLNDYLTLSYGDGRVVVVKSTPQNK